MSTELLRSASASRTYLTLIPYRIGCHCNFLRLSYLVNSKRTGTANRPAGMSWR